MSQRLSGDLSSVWVRAKVGQVSLCSYDHYHGTHVGFSGPLGTGSG